MERAETKSEYIVRAKASLRADLRAKSWPEKVQAIARMNAASKVARESMDKTLAGNTLDGDAFSESAK